MILFFLFFLFSINPILFVLFLSHVSSFSSFQLISLWKHSDSIIYIQEYAPNTFSSSMSVNKTKSSQWWLEKKDSAHLPVRSPWTQKSKKKSCEWWNGHQNRCILFSLIKMKLSSTAFYDFDILSISWDDFDEIFMLTDENKKHRFSSPVHHKKCNFSEAKCIMSFDFVCVDGDDGCKKAWKTRHSCWRCARLWATYWKFSKQVPTLNMNCFEKEKKLLISSTWTLVVRMAIEESSWFDRTVICFSLLCFEFSYPIMNSRCIRTSETVNKWNEHLCSIFILIVWDSLCREQRSRC